MPSLFHGPTIDDARTAARERLGADAVLLEERCVRQGGLRGMLGATEYVVEADYPAPPELPAPPLPLPRRKAFANGVYDLIDTPVREANNHEDIDSLKQEVRHMRALLHRLNRSTTPWRDEMSQLRRAFEESRPAPSGPARIRRLLDQSGIDGRMARGLGRKLRKYADREDELFEAYRDHLADMIRVAAWPLANNDKKLVALVGPPGVGKTTTAAKIAARAINDFDMSVTLVAADIYRVAAIDQLSRYATLLGADIEVAATASDLHAIARNAKTDLVIVDTSGRAPQADDVAADLGAGRLDGDKETGWENRTRHVLLCLPAALRSTDADELARTYECTGPTSVAVTKIDLTQAPAGLLLGTEYADLPVSTLCAGQRVPEDISPASTGAILGYLAPDRSKGTK
jgi:flagellar biosynthesis protein FlhF